MSIKTSPPRVTRRHFLVVCRHRHGSGRCGRSGHFETHRQSKRCRRTGSEIQVQLGRLQLSQATARRSSPELTLLRLCRRLCQVRTGGHGADLVLLSRRRRPRRLATTQDDTASGKAWTSPGTAVGNDFGHPPGEKRDEQLTTGQDVGRQCRDLERAGDSHLCRTRSWRRHRRPKSTSGWSAAWKSAASTRGSTACTWPSKIMAVRRPQSRGCWHWFATSTAPGSASTWTRATFAATTFTAT